MWVLFLQGGNWNAYNWQPTVACAEKKLCHSNNILWSEYIRVFHKLDEIGKIGISSITMSKQIE